MNAAIIAPSVIECGLACGRELRSYFSEHEVLIAMGEVGMRGMKQNGLAQQCACDT